MSVRECYVSVVWCRFFVCCWILCFIFYYFVTRSCCHRIGGDQSPPVIALRFLVIS